MEREASPGRAVGRLLRDQREARGLSINDVEKRLRIRLQYIEAIEQGRFDLLPGAAYFPAFLRAYATNVGLDPGKSSDGVPSVRHRADQTADGASADFRSPRNAPRSVSPFSPYCW